MTDLKNKIALITGAGKNRKIALALAKEGVNLIPIARTKAEIDNAAVKHVPYGKSNCNYS
jgi:3-oxoacyl-[acyl-carrier protein] reductase